MGNEEGLPLRKEIDSSSLTAYMTCQRKFKFRYVDGLVKEVEDLPTHFGRAIHEALNVLYQDFSKVDEAVEVFKANYTENLEKDNKRTYELGEWIIRNYAQRYADQPIKLIKTEFEFVVDFDDFKYIGRIDKIVEWDGILWVLDHKTMSSIPRNYIHTTYPNLQLIGYVWAARQLGFDVKGTIIDAILVAKGLLSAATREKMMPLARYDLYVQDFMIEEWIQTTRQILDNIKQSIETGVYTPNFAACTYYGLCPYHAICREPPAIRDKVVEMDYKKDHWHPHSTKEDKNEVDSKKRLDSVEAKEESVQDIAHNNR